MVSTAKSGTGYGDDVSDRDLRRAEREASGNGDPEAAARLLVARVRAGTLASTRLEHAAAVGHDAACRALGSTAREFPRVDDLIAAIDDPHLAIFALTIAVRRIAPVEADPISTARVDAAAAWSACPCDEHGRDARRLEQVPEFALGLRGPYVEGALRVVEAASLFHRGGGTREFLGVTLRCVREGAPDGDEAALAWQVREELLDHLLA